MDARFFKFSYFQQWALLKLNQGLSSETILINNSCLKSYQIGFTIQNAKDELKELEKLNLITKFDVYGPPQRVENRFYTLSDDGKLLLQSVYSRINEITDTLNCQAHLKQNLNELEYETYYKEFKSKDPLYREKFDDLFTEENVALSVKILKMFANAESNSIGI